MQTTNRATTGEIVIAVLLSLRNLVLEMTSQDNPIDVDELLVVVAEGLRLEPREQAVVRAQSYLDSAALHAEGGGTAVVGAYLTGDNAALYRSLLFERGRVGLLACVDTALGLARTDLQRSLQIPLWRA